MNKHQGSRRTVWLNGETQSLKIQDETLACFISIARFWEFLLCPGAMSTKSKKADLGSVFLTPGIPMRGRSQPVGELEVQTKNPHFNDISIGRKIRFKRTMLGMSQKQLGSQLGVTFQQIQKYEKGSNRIGAGRLQEIADILNVPISFFILVSQQKKTSCIAVMKGSQVKKSTFF